MSIRELDLNTVPLSGMTLIEAGAGTGKTYTITGLFLRLLLEQELPVERILVVTYTRAATAELRQRIRTRLTEAELAMKEGKTGNDELLKHLISSRKPHWGGLLRRAILDFDRAAVFTIHGFCQRVLGDHAFATGLPFATELIQDQREMIVDIVEDFWRQEIQDLAPELIEGLYRLGLRMDQLTEMIRNYLAKPYLEIRSAEGGIGFETQLAGYLRCFDACKIIWERERQQIVTLLKQGIAGLKRNIYSSDKLAGARDYADLFFLHPTPRFDPLDLQLLTQGKLNKSVKKNHTAPSHDFFRQLDRLLEEKTILDQVVQDFYSDLLKRLIVYANNELKRRKREQRLKSYDDLLLDLNTALKASEGERLVWELQREYAAALIDEFQDTDPVQYQIFERIYAESDLPVFLVGDPKQAIYSFRGADIFAYLKARKAVGQRYTLQTNWRSHPHIIEMVNRLFEREDSFVFSEIPYHLAVPAKKQRDMLIDSDKGDVNCIFTLLEGNGNKDKITARVVAHCAHEIARLLTTEVKLGDRQISGSDIAILVRTHSQGEAVADALRKVGIHAVQNTQQNIFDSWEALELERLLLAVERPVDQGRVLAALGMDILGHNCAAMVELMGDESVMIRFQDRLVDYRRLWLERGFMVMYQRILIEESVMPRLMTLEDGERRITNLRHLGELLHTQEREQKSTPGGLIEWLIQSRRDSSMPSDAHLLRLESDANLVQIVTVHKSKGLQYPVVFLPFAWEGGFRSGKQGRPYLFHDRQAGATPVLELGSERWEENQVDARREELAEQLRNFYVAITRAVNRCYLYWGGEVSGATQSPLGWLLNRFQTDQEVDHYLKEKTKKIIIDNNKLISIFKVNNRMINGLCFNTLPIDGRDLKADDAYFAQRSGDDLQPRVMQHREMTTRRVTSFSALAHQSDQVELPDYDQWLMEGLGEAHESIAATSPGETVFDFPRGANPGSCLHNIFEVLEFTTTQQGAELEGLIEEKLAFYGIDKRWTGVACDLVMNVLETPLPDPEISSTPSLSKIPEKDKLVELPFYFPLKSLQSRRLLEIIGRHYADNPLILQAINRLSFKTVQGYLKGFVDLVFRFQGHYYLVDYKSNWLGDRVADYSHAAMTDAIAREGYYLQYLLYTLALHRYLRLKVKGYRYQEHFAGAYYLFLRGMQGTRGGNTGVYFDRPAPALIKELDDYFQGVTG